MGKALNLCLLPHLKDAMRIKGDDVTIHLAQHCHPVYAGQVLHLNTYRK